MKRMLVCFVVALMAVAVQAQTGEVEKAIAGMERRGRQPGRRAMRTQ